jgi:DNA-binding response OmpR family regulator
VLGCAMEPLPLRWRLILICEDEPLIALDIANAFTNAGACVVTSRSLLDSLVAVENSGLSAAILNHTLKGGDSSPLRERLSDRGASGGH